jgi:hypothetical protein
LGAKLFFFECPWGTGGMVAGVLLASALRTCVCTHVS